MADARWAIYPAAIDLLAADGPYAEHADKLMLYGRLVGSWNVQSVNFNPDGTQTKRQGEWHFAWVLGGRGVQDVLFVSGTAACDYGTTLRCYDARIDAWRVSWMMPVHGEFVHMIGRQDGDRIVQVGFGSEPGHLERWIFSEITPDSFLWQGEVSRDEGRSYTLVQEMRAARRA